MAAAKTIKNNSTLEGDFRKSTCLGLKKSRLGSQAEQKLTRKEGENIYFFLKNPENMCNFNKITTLRTDDVLVSHGRHVTRTKQTFSLQEIIYFSKREK